MNNAPYIVVFETTSETLPPDLLAFIRSMQYHELNKNAFVIRTGSPISVLSDSIQERTPEAVGVSVFALGSQFKRRGSQAAGSKLINLVGGPA